MNEPHLRLRTRLLRAIGRSGLPGRHRLVSYLAPCGRGCAATPFEVELHGTRYRGNLAEFIDWHIFYFGSYAMGELTFLASCFRYVRRWRERVNFFDIGANVGEFSTFMASRATTVHAFEPNGDLVGRLRAHVARNDLRNVSLHAIALGEDDHRAELGSGFPGNPGSRSLMWTMPGAAGEPVQVRRGDTYFADADLPRLDIVKIDVEGYEKPVVRGLSARLRADRPIILMELIGDGPRGGFESEADMRRNLYPDHLLRLIAFHGSRYRLARFDWDCEAAVVLPAEYAELV